MCVPDAASLTNSRMCSRKGSKGKRAPFAERRLLTKPHTMAPIIIRITGINSTGGPFEIEVSIPQIVADEPLLHQEVETPFAPPAGRQGPRPPLLHALATRLTDANRAGLENLAYWSTSLRSIPDYLLNMALREYLVPLKGAKHQRSSSEPLVPEKILRALPTGRKGRRLPLIHAFATQLNDPNKAGLDYLSHLKTNLENPRDYFINEALAHYLPQFKGSYDSSRLSNRPQSNKRGRINQ